MGVAMNSVRIEKRERSAAGKLIKWAFIAFNLLMALWIVGGLHSVSQIPTHSTAEQIGAGIGTTLGVAMVLTIWVFGDLILGIPVLLTRGDKIITEQSIVSSATSMSTFSDSSFDMSRVDERIAQLKAEASASLPKPNMPAPASPSFGRRRA
jgi:hypothetical protein